MTLLGLYAALISRVADAYYQLQAIYLYYYYYYYIYYFIFLIFFNITFINFREKEVA